MYGKIKDFLSKELQEIKDNGLYKKERIIISPQGAIIKISTGEEVINFCANNYLGLSSNKEVIQAAKDTMDTHGFGVSSVRFICGTQDIHKELEEKIAEYYQQKILFYMQLHLMPMVVYSNPYFPRKMQLYPIH